MDEELEEPMVRVRRAPDWEWHWEPASVAYSYQPEPGWPWTQSKDPEARWQVIPSIE